MIDFNTYKRAMEKGIFVSKVEGMLFNDLFIPIGTLVRIDTITNSYEGILKSVEIDVLVLHCLFTNDSKLFWFSDIVNIEALKGERWIKYYNEAI